MERMVRNDGAFDRVIGGLWVGNIADIYTKGKVGDVLRHPNELG